MLHMKDLHLSETMFCDFFPVSSKTLKCFALPVFILHEKTGNDIADLGSNFRSELAFQLYTVHCNLVPRVFLPAAREGREGRERPWQTSQKSPRILEIERMRFCGKLTLLTIIIAGSDAFLAKFSLVCCVL